MNKTKLVALFAALIIVVASVFTVFAADADVMTAEAAALEDWYLDYDIIACDADGNVPFSAVSQKDKALVTYEGKVDYYKLTLYLKNVPAAVEAYDGTAYYAEDIVLPEDNLATIDVSYIRPKYYNESNVRTENLDNMVLGMNGKTGDGMSVDVFQKDSDGILTAATHQQYIYAVQMTYYLKVSGEACADGNSYYNAIEVNFANNLNNSVNNYNTSFYLENELFTIPVYCNADGTSETIPEASFAPEELMSDFMMYFLDTSLVRDTPAPTLTDYQYNTADIDGKYMYLPINDIVNVFNFSISPYTNYLFDDNETFEISTDTQSFSRVKTISQTSNSTAFRIVVGETEEIVPITFTRKVFGKTIDTFVVKLVTYYPDGRFLQLKLENEEFHTEVSAYNASIFIEDADPEYLDAMSYLYDCSWSIVSDGVTYSNGKGFGQTFGRQTTGEHQVVVEVSNNLIQQSRTFLDAYTTYVEEGSFIQTYAPYVKEIRTSFEVLRYYDTTELTSLSVKGGNRQLVELFESDGSVSGEILLELEGEIVDSNVDIQWRCSNENVELVDGGTTKNNASQAVGIMGVGVYKVTAYVITEDNRFVEEEVTIIATIDADSQILLANKEEIKMAANTDDDTLQVGYNLDGVFTPYYGWELYCNSDDPTVAVAAFDSFNNKIVISAIADGETNINVAVMGEDSFRFVSVKVIVGEGNAEEEPYVAPVITFVNGGKLIMYLQDTAGKSVTVTGGDITAGSYSFYSLYENVATVTYSGNIATVIPTGVGNTIIVATYKDNATGNMVHAKLEAEIVAEKPTVKVTVKRNGGNTDAALNIYDTLTISAEHSYDFSYSTSAVTEWYLDGTKLEVTTKSFNTKLTAGTHTLRVVIRDSVYGISIDESKSVSIAVVNDAERVLTMTESGKIYLALEGTPYTVSALLDNIIDDAYEYTWGVDNNNVLTAAHADGKSYEVQLIPRAAGTTTVFVYVTVGVYESKVIRASLDIEVQAIDSLTFAGAEDYYKPGNTGVFTLICNGRADFKNLNPTFAVKSEDAEIAFSQNGNTITVEGLNEGTLVLTASVIGRNAENEYKITSFNLQQFTREILPYLVIVLAFVLLIVFALRGRKSSLQVIKIKIAKAEAYIDKVIGQTGRAVDAKRLKWKFRALYSKTKHIKMTADYARDKGMDEISVVSDEAMRIMKILTAVIASVDKTSDGLKLQKIFVKLKSNNFSYMKNAADTVFNVREKFYEEINEVAKAEVVAEEQKQKKNLRFGRKKQKEFEDFTQYLNDMRYMDNSDFDSSDDDK